MAISTVGLKTAQALKSNARVLYKNLGQTVTTMSKDVPDVFICSAKSIKSEQSGISKILAKAKNFFSRSKTKPEPDLSDIFKTAKTELPTDAQIIKFNTNPFSKNAQNVITDSKKSKFADILDDVNIFKSTKTKKIAKKAKFATKKVIKKSKNNIFAKAQKSLKNKFPAAKVKIQNAGKKLPFYTSRFKTLTAKTFEEFKAKVDNSPAMKFAKSIIKAEREKTQRIVHEHYISNKIDYNMRKKQYEIAKAELKEKITKFKDAIKNGDKSQIQAAKSSLIQAQYTLKDAKAYLDIAANYLARAAKLALENIS